MKKYTIYLLSSDEKGQLIEVLPQTFDQLFPFDLLWEIKESIIIRGYVILDEKEKVRKKENFVSYFLQSGDKFKLSANFYPSSSL